MTDFHDDTPFWDQPDWPDITATPRSRRPYERTRTHHVVRRRDSLPPLDEWTDVDAWVEPEPRHPRPRRRGSVGVDPRLLRLGVATVAVVLMVPIALAIRDEDGAGDLRSQDLADTPVTTAASERLTNSATRATKPRRQRTDATTAPGAEAAADDGASDSEEATSDDAAGEVLTVSAEPEPEPACAGEYEVVAGDYWWRFAETTDELDAWLSVNDATTDTPLYTGDVLCIPEGASAPAPPPSTTEAPTTTDPPRTTEAPETTPAPTEAPTTTEAPETTPAPTTTDPPETTAPPPSPPPADPGSAEAIIREIWPDEIEERALEIARRESSLDPSAYNGWCCYGLFQIYFDSNRDFLATLGITSPDRLLDARTNTEAAFAMYQQSGWSPWSTTDPGPT